MANIDVNDIITNYNDEEIISYAVDTVDLYDDYPMNYYEVLDYLDNLSIETVVINLQGLDVIETNYYSIDGYGWLKDLGDSRETAVMLLENYEEVFNHFAEDMEEELKRMGEI